MNRRQALGLWLFLFFALTPTTEAFFFTKKKLDPVGPTSFREKALSRLASLSWQTKAALIACSGLALLAIINKLIAQPQVSIPSSPQPTTDPALIPIYTTELYKAGFAMINRRFDFLPDHHFLLPVTMEHEISAGGPVKVPSNIANQPPYQIDIAMIGEKSSFSEYLLSLIGRYSDQCTLLICPRELREEQNAAITPRALDMADYLVTAYKKPVMLVDFRWQGSPDGKLAPSDTAYLDAASCLDNCVHHFCTDTNRTVSSIFMLAQGTSCKLASFTANILARQPQGQTRSINSAIFINDSSNQANEIQSPANTLYNIFTSPNGTDNAQRTRYQTQHPGQHIHDILLTHDNDNRITRLQDISNSR